MIILATILSLTITMSIRNRLALHLPSFKWQQKIHITHEQILQVVEYVEHTIFLETHQMLIVFENGMFFSTQNRTSTN